MADFTSIHERKGQYIAPRNAKTPEYAKCLQVHPDASFQSPKTSPSLDRRPQTRGPVPSFRIDSVIHSRFYPSHHAAHGQQKSASPRPGCWSQTLGCLWGAVKTNRSLLPTAPIDYLGLCSLQSSKEHYIEPKLASFRITSKKDSAQTPACPTPKTSSL